MSYVDKTIYYYLILFAIFLTSFSFIPIIFEVMQQKLISNIPYVTIILILLTFLIYTFIAIVKKYYIHLFFYFIGLISISILLYLKIIYNNSNSIEILKYKDFTS